MTLNTRLLTALLLLTASLTPTHAQTPRTPAAATRTSGAATLQLAKDLLTVAPKRFNGSPGHLAAETFIKSHFLPEAKDNRFYTDTFTATTPAGLQTMHNFIVRYPGKKDGFIVLGTHYETNFPLKDIAFYGANDGAATTALLIALGQSLRTHPPTGYSIVLVFFDGEEAVQSWGPQDSLYGSRHLAAKWSQDGTLNQVKAFLNADMIGDKDLDIDQDANSDPTLIELMKTAARNIGHPNIISKDKTGIEDDTVPFQKRGVKVLDVIDYNYGPHTAGLPDGYHHTAQDTLDKISAQSLQISADLFQELIRQIDQH